ncbi:hypothetical protein FB451DRAFT_1455796 [Mycena latifolia]|nr:hypothetical protein FB451DRAFT_1455796 [Mycena latifolia]
MSARRQPSTTSLSRYARGASPGPEDRSTDFCNAFWGYGDGGVDVLFARMRGAARTMDELRNFWKERASIEDEYARRLAKLSKQVLGRDEIGELRNSLDTLRAETERQASSHLTLSQQIRTECEGQCSSFYTKQQHHKKTYQSAIEKEFKAKQTQEGYVTKAREKYETDCMRINSYTAQLGLVQGKDAERIHLKLERAQQTVVSNERDFANFARALADTVAKWEQDWKVFCDSCQDLEEERLGFTKDNVWLYANAVSTVCVSDDESCEKMRLALEQMEAERDMESFVRDYGTGPQIPDPPAYVNFSDPNAVPSSSSQPTFRHANFPRSSQRPPPVRRSSVPPEDDQPATNAAGVGAGGGIRRGDDPPPAAAPLVRQNTQSRASTVSVHQQQPQQPPQQQQQQQQQHTNGINGVSSPAEVARRPSSYRVPPRDPLAEPIDPTADTFIKVGPNAYRVDLTRDPQQQGASSSRMTLSSSPQNGGFDPLAKQMEDLQSASGTVRRRSTRGDPRASSQPRRGTMDATPPNASSSARPMSSNASARPLSSMSLAAPNGSNAAQQQQQQQQQRAPSPARDYRYSADSVVGPHPSASRPASPNPAPITAAFMRPASAAGPPGAEVIADVLTDYHQSLPGERKSVSRSNSRRGSYSGAPSPGPGSSGGGHAYNASQSSQQGAGPGLARPPSQMGYAGIGTGSRSASPQPPSRGPSPAPGAPPPNASVRQSFIAPPPQTNHIGRQGAVSPNNVGIALDSSGRVLHDEMAQRYQQQQAQRQSVPPPQGAYGQPQRRLSYMGPGGGAGGPPPPQPGYGAVTPYQQPGYVPPPPPLQQPYAPPPAPAPAPSPYQAPPPPQVYQPQPHASAYGAVNGLQRGVSTGSGGGGYFPQHQQQQQQQLVRAPTQQQQQLVRVPQGQQQQQLQVAHQHPQQHQQAMRRSPSPGPAAAQHQGQTSDGKWILFYVKALFNYAATIDEEFDFTEGDIIAVTATPEDGWWHGELLDEARRVPGRYIFPSNFVVLF